MSEQENTFAIYAYRFGFRAVDELTFPAVAANTIRGALGNVLKSADFEEADFFRPKRIGGPSGFIDRPRPFVLRAHLLNERRVCAGEEFAFDAHFFERGTETIAPFSKALRRFASIGIGRRRSRVELMSIRQIDSQRRMGEAIDADALDRYEPSVWVDLDMGREASSGQVAVEFATPLELKSNGTVMTDVPFEVLFARLSERISALSLFYGQGLKTIDWGLLREKARDVRTVKSEFNWIEAERRSSRTGQRHSLGGLAGTAVYEGNVAGFLPWLQAGYWTGVGRHTVWGKGVVRATMLD